MRDPTAGSRRPVRARGRALGGGVTGKPVAESERERHRKTIERNCVKSEYWSEYAMNAGKEDFAEDSC